MNNRNGAALLARIQPGDLVTVRRADGGTLTGRADPVGHPSDPAGSWRMVARGGIYLATESNIVSFRPRDAV